MNVDSISLLVCTEERGATLRRIQSLRPLAGRMITVEDRDLLEVDLPQGRPGQQDDTIPLGGPIGGAAPRL